MNKDVTIVIKTFCRVWLAKRLCKSIKNHLPDVRILLVDDGSPRCSDPKKQWGVPWPDTVEHVDLPFDVGLSAGRNHGVEMVDTPYTIIFDDDFIVTAANPILESIPYIRQHDLDVLGYRIKNDRQEVLRWTCDFKTIRGNLYRVPAPDETIDRHWTCRMCLNCFIAKTDSLKRIKWDDDLKVAEHFDFFYRGAIDPDPLKVGVFQTGHIEHKRSTTKATYMKYRNRAPYYRKLAAKKHGFRNYVG